MKKDDHSPLTTHHMPMSKEQIEAAIDERLVQRWRERCRQESAAPVAIVAVKQLAGRDFGQPGGCHLRRHAGRDVGGLAAGRGQPAASRPPQWNDEKGVARAMTREEVQSMNLVAQRGQKILQEIDSTGAWLQVIEKGACGVRVQLSGGDDMRYNTVALTPAAMAVVKTAVRNSLTTTLADLHEKLAHLDANRIVGPPIEAPLTTHHSPPTKEEPCSTNRS